MYIVAVKCYVWYSMYASLGFENNSCKRELKYCFTCLIHVDKNFCGCLFLIIPTDLVKATHYSDLTGGF